MLYLLKKTSDYLLSRASEHQLQLRSLSFFNWARSDITTARKWHYYDSKEMQLSSEIGQESKSSSAVQNILQESRKQEWVESLIIKYVSNWEPQHINNTVQKKRKTLKPKKSGLSL